MSAMVIFGLIASVALLFCIRNAELGQMDSRGLSVPNPKLHRCWLSSSLSRQPIQRRCILHRAHLVSFWSVRNHPNLSRP